MTKNKNERKRDLKCQEWKTAAKSDTKAENRKWKGRKRRRRKENFCGKKHENENRQ